MKVAILYPPVGRKDKFPVMTQSRIFSFTHSHEIRIYPLVMASAATMLDRDGFSVAWFDGLAAGDTPGAWWRKLESFRPDLAVVETKTSLVRAHWTFVNELKERLPDTKTALVGDHVSYFPAESLAGCRADYAVAGGDYDLSILGIAKSLRDDAKGASEAGVGRALLATGASFAGGGARQDLPGGVWSMKDGTPTASGAYAHAPSLDSLPWIDRDLTDWKMYGEAYLKRPVAYILSGRGCGGVKRPGACTFCIWQYAFWGRKPRLRDPRDVAREVAHLVDRYGVREVFDDNEAGGIWDLEWLRGFADELTRIGAAGKVQVSSNCRADSVTPDRCELMKRAGYRMLKIGLESGNDDTLKRIRKDETVDEIIRGVKLAKDHGFNVMVTVMVGFPWEGKRELERTYEVAKELLFYSARTGDCLEANVAVPYPGTPLHLYVRENGWFEGDPADYDRYGMPAPLLKCPVDSRAWGRRLWRLHWHPEFVARSLFTVRSASDLGLALRGVRSLAGHLRDYGRDAESDQTSKP
jgi:radical SAM superfamily enzyme YgiQ (UPF0313 family)